MRPVSKFRIVLITATLPLSVWAGQRQEQPRMWRHAQQSARLTQGALVHAPVVRPAENLSRTELKRVDTKRASAAVVEVRRSSRTLSGLRRLFGRTDNESSKSMAPQTTAVLQKKGRLP